MLRRKMRQVYFVKKSLEKCVDETLLTYYGSQGGKMDISLVKKICYSMGDVCKLRKNWADTTDELLKRLEAVLIM